MFSEKFPHLQGPCKKFPLKVWHEYVVATIVLHNVQMTFSGNMIEIHDEHIAQYIERTKCLNQDPTANPREDIYENYFLPEYDE